MIKCICINDKDKPKKIPIEKWVVEGKEYTIQFVLTVLPSEELAFQLEEIDLDESCFPYAYFSASRFAFTEDDFQKLIEFNKECSEISTSVKELMNEREPNTIEEN